jgi:murein DD-endopeptidase MepM/ murein hydrolase activator NlpD
MNTGRYRRCLWRAAVSAILLALLATGLAPAGAAHATPVPADASIQATHQMPFPCGQTWSGQTRTGHSPQRAIDLTRGGNTNGSPVVASAAGTVIHRGTLAGTGYGNLVVIRHSDGTATYYAHLSGFTVSLNQSVGQGQQVGNVGSTGNSTGPHLHYEQRTAFQGTAVPIVWNGSQVLYYGTRSYTSNNCAGSTNPYTPTQVCGTGYGVIDSQALGAAGRVYLLWNDGNGNNCVVTLKTSSVGTPTRTIAFLEPQGSTRTTDAGDYGYYAGPVRRFASGTCVRWGGTAGGVSYTSPFEHCGG